MEFSSKCTDLFKTLQAFMAEAIISGGDNRVQPHTKHLNQRIEIAQTQATTSRPVTPPLPDPEIPLSVRIQLPPRLQIRITIPTLPSTANQNGDVATND